MWAQLLTPFSLEMSTFIWRRSYHSNTNMDRHTHCCTGTLIFWQNEKKYLGNMMMMMMMMMRGAGCPVKSFLFCWLLPAPLLIDSKTWTIEARARRRVRRWLWLGTVLHEEKEHLHNTSHKSLVSRANQQGNNTKTPNHRNERKDEVVHDLRKKRSLCV